MGFFIDMINVGQGDSFLLTLDNKAGGIHYILIDGGSVQTSDVLVAHLKSITTGHIDVVIVTHLDNDHIGGLKKVIENFNIGCFLMNTPGNLKTWLLARETLKEIGQRVNSVQILVESLSMTEDLLDVISHNKIIIEPAMAGRWWKHGEDIVIRILNPTPNRLKAAWADELLKETVQGTVLAESNAPDTTASNNSSVVLELEYKGVPYALFTGDAGADVIKEIIGKKQYPFLKVPHHGSKTALDEELLGIIKPTTAFLSVGDNPHGHPATEALDIIKKVGAKVYCTNKTKYCRKDCKYTGYGNICHMKDKNSRPNWSNVDPNKCINNG